MKYLIDNIIMRCEAMQAKEEEVFKNERKSIPLDQEEKNETSIKRREQKKEKSRIN